jgi:tRNA1(Val) A37 N6-methylase TrmN6
MPAAPSIPNAATSDDALLAGRVRLRQPRRGYRAAIDPVLLAAAMPERARRVVDLGCGVGAATLCLAVRRPDATITGVELDPDLAALARENAAANGCAERVDVVTADVAAWTPDDVFDAAMLNPPYLPAESADPSPVPGRRQANVEGDADLSVWLDTALRCVAHKGAILVIHRADRLDDLLHGLRGRAGEAVVFPLWPKQGEDAKRIIVRARKGVRTPLRLAAGLVLHEPDGRYTDAAQAVLTGAALRF